MAVSVFDMFSIGIGPSSSHTVGPMAAAADFVTALGSDGTLAEVTELSVDLYGSLASTGRGHGTFGAVLLGLEGHRPDQVTAERVDARLEAIAAGGPLHLGGELEHPGPDLDFGIEDMTLRPLTYLPRHSNAMRFAVRAADGTALAERTAYSIGGGFVVVDGEEDAGPVLDEQQVPHPFENGEQLLRQCARTGLDVAQLVMANEAARCGERAVRARLLEIWQVMEECKDSSLTRTGHLPGGLRTQRRAPAWYRRLLEKDPDVTVGNWVEWVNLVALAVNEENASGGRIVTAPTNGAAGIIPAVLFYATHYAERGGDQKREEWPGIVVDFLLAAGAVGSVIKEQSSISGAEVGCQGEVGSASAMAAAGLAQVMGGCPMNVAEAAEIAMEHHLGLTCDPIGGLVQVPCIERNAIAAVTAVNAARMSIWEDRATTMVSLDQVVRTMKQTGEDMSSKYKETAQGGLAVNVVEC